MSQTLLGMNVIISAHVRPAPALQLRHDFTACTDEFRAEMNSWLLDRFGTREVAYVLDNKNLVMNHDTLVRLKRRLYSAGLP